MKTKCLTMAALTALAFAMPASAQYASGANVSWRINQVQADLQTGVSNGTINRTEARTLREQLRQLRALERRYAVNGLSNAERQDLQRRVVQLRQNVRVAARTDNIRYGQSGWIDANRDGYDDRDYNRDGRIDDVRYGQSGWIDANRDGYDDRDYDRDGRWDDDTYAQGGPYETDSCAYRTDRGGLGGVIDNVLGRDPCYTVGQRINGRLDALPSRYRGQFRPGVGRYLGYGDGRVYEVDSRTGVVTRVYRVD